MYLPLNKDLATALISCLLSVSLVFTVSVQHFSGAIQLLSSPLMSLSNCPQMDKNNPLVFFLGGVRCFYLCPHCAPMHTLCTMYLVHTFNCHSFHSLELFWSHRILSINHILAHSPSLSVSHTHTGLFDCIVINLRALIRNRFQQQQFPHFLNVSSFFNYRA